MKSYTILNFSSLILISFVFMNFQCDNCEDELHDRSSFSTTLNTLQSQIEVGDTLIMSASFSSQIELEISKMTHDNSNQLINYTLEIFKAVENDVNAIQARNDFDFIDMKSSVFVPESRTWEVNIENFCGNSLCELEFGFIPKKAGYYGLFLRTGIVGISNSCQFLTLMPTAIESNGNNNFDTFSEINVSRIRVDGVFFSNPKSEERLFFFKVK